MSEPAPVHIQRTQHLLHRTAAGFTLIELMVVVAVLGVIALLAGPSFLDMIVMQRLRGINAQLVTDLQFARSEAVAQGKIVRVNFGSATDRTCYVIYTAAGNGTQRCDCTANTVCPASATFEVRTVAVPKSTGVELEVISGPLTTGGAVDTAFGFDPVTGGLVAVASDSATNPPTAVEILAAVDSLKRLRTDVAETGRPRVCAPSSANLGVAACPAPPPPE